jgi:hypothetical protein
MALGRIDAPLVVVWTALVVAAALLTVWAAVGRPRPRGWITVLRVLSLSVPVAALVLSYAAFAGGGHPLVQYNDDTTFGGWSTWARLYPFLLFGGLGTLVLAFVSELNARADWGGLLFIALILANALTLWAVGKNWPSA